MSAVKNYDIFDLAKFILSLFIVSLHSGIVPDILIPVIRTAVPLFFMISSYLFFEKKSALAENSAGGGYITKIRQPKSETVFLLGSSFASCNCCLRYTYRFSFGDKIFSS